MTEPYKFRDQDGDRLGIEPSLSTPGAAIVSTSRPVIVPAHRLAEVVAAMYEAAGQQVPDLPVIHDEADVESLATLLHFARENISHGFGEHDVKVARALLAHGVRLPEAR